VSAEECAFCKIAAGESPAAIVYEDELCLAFLDTHPLLKGHVLLVPRVHRVTLEDLEPELVGTLFAVAQVLSRAVRTAMNAQGSFVAMNNVVSQSVPHFHVHVVPRSRGDGLKGFFWPRTRYESEDEMESICRRIRSALEQPS
jgi:histidine triad (HIT) family protein